MLTTANPIQKEPINFGLSGCDKRGAETALSKAPHSHTGWQKRIVVNLCENLE